ncbi:MAG: aminoacyl-tRNA hydrolase [Lachnospiraceae bacterium]|nr:aminoacyl-tRNA hydrolase [Lachnospiraceae bacterium]
MYIIVGLGNPGKQYEKTRHNVGYSCVDAIAKENGIAVLECKHKALIGKGYIDGEKVILVKPLTYMNLSGESVREVIDYYKVDETTNLIIIYDDISLEAGALRIRKKGSAGGHNGIKNIISCLGHDTFKRIKVGVGEKPKGYDLADYVLGHFSKEEQKIMEESVLKVSQAVKMLIKEEVDAAMNRFN